MEIKGWSSFWRRLAAFGIDWVIISIWGVAVFAAVMIITGGQPQKPAGPWIAQAQAFPVMTLPVLLYFSWLESSRFAGTLGKRALGMRVVRKDQTSVSFLRGVARNAIKFLPWELGHLVAQQAFYSSESGMPVWVLAPLACSLLLPIWWGMSILLTGSAPYDQLTQTRVIECRNN